MWMIDSLDLAAISVSVSVLLPEQSIALVRNANQGPDRWTFVTKIGGAATPAKRTIKDENRPHA